MPDNGFIKLETCPVCDSEVGLMFDRDHEVYIECTGCFRQYAVGTPIAEARVMCTYWNHIVKRDTDA